MSQTHETQQKHSTDYDGSAFELSAEGREIASKAFDEVIDRYNIEADEMEGNIKANELSWTPVGCAVKSLDPGNELGEEHDDEMNDDDDEKEVEEPSQCPSIWDTFVASAVSIRDWAADFEEGVKKALISSKTKKYILKVCGEYFDLLLETSMALQKCRFTSERTLRVINDVVKVIMITKREQESDQAVSEKKLEGLGKIMTKKFRALIAMVDDTTHIRVIEELQGKWEKMKKKLEDLAALVREDDSWMRTKMAVLGGIGGVVLVALTVTLVIFSVGVVAAPAFSAGIAKATTVFSAANISSVTSALTMAAYLMMEPDVKAAVDHAKLKHVNAIKKGLTHIANQSHQMKAMLHVTIKSWNECRKRQYSKEGDVDEQGPNVLEEGLSSFNDYLQAELVDDAFDELETALDTCKKNLALLIGNIKKTEDAIEAEVQNYKENVHSRFVKVTF